MGIPELRQEYHRRICNEVVRITTNPTNRYPNFADSGNKSSRDIAWGLVDSLGCAPNHEKISGQTAGDRFKIITKDFLASSFGLLQHLRPGNWSYVVEFAISNFDQYEHLSLLESIIEREPTLSSALGGNYIIKPDIVIGRHPVSDEEINRFEEIIRERSFSGLTPLREINYEIARQILHASISCKWTIRSDRSQNVRTEALNLIRNRKGPLPHFVAVIGEPLPTRISSVALGTGDLDCVYHFALNELKEVIEGLNNQDQLDMLLMMIEGRRLRDISDLPFDLAT
jgi:hypothetical protein